MDIHTPLDPEDFGHLRVSTMRRTYAPRYCVMPGCDGEIRTSGLCAAHYNRSLRGLPLDVVIKRRNRKGRL